MRGNIERNKSTDSIYSTMCIGWFDYIITDIMDDVLGGGPGGVTCVCVGGRGRGEMELRFETIYSHHVGASVVVYACVRTI